MEIGSSTRVQSPQEATSHASTAAPLPDRPQRSQLNKTQITSGHRNKSYSKIMVDNSKQFRRQDSSIRSGYAGHNSFMEDPFRSTTTQIPQAQNLLISHNFGQTQPVEPLSPNDSQVTRSQTSFAIPHSSTAALLRRSSPQFFQQRMNRENSPAISAVVIPNAQSSHQLRSLLNRRQMNSSMDNIQYRANYMQQMQATGAEGQSVIMLEQLKDKLIQNLIEVENFQNGLQGDEQSPLTSFRNQRLPEPPTSNSIRKNIRRIRSVYRQPKQKKQSQSHQVSPQRRVFNEDASRADVGPSPLVQPISSNDTFNQVPLMISEDIIEETKIPESPAVNANHSQSPERSQVFEQNRPRGKAFLDLMKFAEGIKQKTQNSPPSNHKNEVSPPLDASPINSNSSLTASRNKRATSRSSNRRDSTCSRKFSVGSGASRSVKEKSSKSHSLNTSPKAVSVKVTPTNKPSKIKPQLTFKVPPLTQVNSFNLKSNKGVQRSKTKNHSRSKTQKSQAGKPKHIRQSSQPIHIHPKIEVKDSKNEVVAIEHQPSGSRQDRSDPLQEPSITITDTSMRTQPEVVGLEECGDSNRGGVNNSSVSSFQVQKLGNAGKTQSEVVNLLHVNSGKSFSSIPLSRASSQVSKRSKSKLNQNNKKESEEKTKKVNIKNLQITKINTMRPSEMRGILTSSPQKQKTSYSKATNIFDFQQEVNQNKRDLFLKKAARVKSEAMPVQAVMTKDSDKMVCLTNRPTKRTSRVRMSKIETYLRNKAKEALNESNEDLDFKEYLFPKNRSIYHEEEICDLHSQYQKQQEYQIRQECQISDSRDSEFENMSHKDDDSQFQGNDALGEDWYTGEQPIQEFQQQMFTSMTEEDITQPSRRLSNIIIKTEDEQSYQINEGVNKITEESEDSLLSKKSENNDNSQEKVVQQKSDIIIDICGLDDVSQNSAERIKRPSFDIQKVSVVKTRSDENVSFDDIQRSQTDNIFTNYNALLSPEPAPSISLSHENRKSFYEKKFKSDDTSKLAKYRRTGTFIQTQPDEVSNQLKLQISQQIDVNTKAQIVGKGIAESKVDMKKRRLTKRMSVAMNAKPTYSPRITEKNDDLDFKQEMDKFRDQCQQSNEECLPEKVQKTPINLRQQLVTGFKTRVEMDRMQWKIWEQERLFQEKEDELLKSFKYNELLLIRHQVKKFKFLPKIEVCALDFSNSEEQNSKEESVSIPLIFESVQDIPKDHFQIEFLKELNLPEQIIHPSKDNLAQSSFMQKSDIFEFSSQKKEFFKLQTQLRELDSIMIEQNDNKLIFLQKTPHMDGYVPKEVIIKNLPMEPPRKRDYQQQIPQITEISSVGFNLLYYGPLSDPKTYLQFQFIQQMCAPTIDDSIDKSWDFDPNLVEFCASETTTQYDNILKSQFGDYLKILTLDKNYKTPFYENPDVEQYWIETLINLCNQNIKAIEEREQYAFPFKQIKLMRKNQVFRRRIKSGKTKLFDEKEETQTDPDESIIMPQILIRTSNKLLGVDLYSKIIGLKNMLNGIDKKFGYMGYLAINQQESDELPIYEKIVIEDRYQYFILAKAAWKLRIIQIQNSMICHIDEQFQPPSDEETQLKKAKRRRKKKLFQKRQLSKGNSIQSFVPLLPKRLEGHKTTAFKMTLINHDVELELQDDKPFDYNNVNFLSDENYSTESIESSSEPEETHSVGSPDIGIFDIKKQVLQDFSTREVKKSPRKSIRESYIGENIINIPQRFFEKEQLKLLKEMGEDIEEFKNNEEAKNEWLRQRSEQLVITPIGSGPHGKSTFASAAKDSTERHSISPVPPSRNDSLFGKTPVGPITATPLRHQTQTSMGTLQTFKAQNKIDRMNEQLIVAKQRDQDRLELIKSDLIQMINSQDQVKTEMCLIQYPNVDLNRITDESGNSLLNIAVRVGSRGITDLFIKAGMDVNKANKAIIDLLIAAGANENAKNSKGKEPWEEEL